MESAIFASGSRKKHSKEILHIHLSIVMCNIFDTWDFMHFWGLCIISGIFFPPLQLYQSTKAGFPHLWKHQQKDKARTTGWNKTPPHCWLTRPEATNKSEFTDSCEQLCREYRHTLTDNYLRYQHKLRSLLWKRAAEKSSWYCEY